MPISCLSLSQSGASTWLRRAASIRALHFQRICKFAFSYFHLASFSFSSDVDRVHLLSLTNKLCVICLCIGRMRDCSQLLNGCCSCVYSRLRSQIHGLAILRKLRLSRHTLSQRLISLSALQRGRTMERCVNESIPAYQSSGLRTIERLFSIAFHGC